MNDDEQEDDTMKGALNTARLTEVVTSQQNVQDSRKVDIHTKAQQRLADDEARAAVLDTEIRDDEDYVVRLDRQMAEMAALRTQTVVNIKERKAERQACLDSAHRLRTEGISLP